MISTVADLLVYGRALGTGKGLLSPEQQSERLGRSLRRASAHQTSARSDLAYGIELGKDQRLDLHNGEIPVTTPNCSSSGLDPWCW